MKWDEIHDQSRVVVDKAIENLLAEGKEVEKKENDIVEKLRDVENGGQQRNIEKSGTRNEKKKGQRIQKKQERPTGEDTKKQKKEFLSFNVATT